MILVWSLSTEVAGLQFSIIVMVTWVVLGTATTTGFLAARSSLLWPGIALAILAVIGLFGGFGFDYLAGHKH